MSDLLPSIDAGSAATTEGDTSLVSPAPITLAEAMGSPKKDKAKAKDLTDSEKALLDSLGELWTRREKVDLEVRHEIGRLINAEIGDPTTRQKRGRGVIRAIENRLGISQPDLSRMRWFAHHFPSVTELVARHPEVKNWTQVKDVLPGMEGVARKAPGSPIQKAVEGVTRKVGQATSLTDEETKKLVTALKQLAKAMDKLQIRVTVSHRKSALAAA